MLSYWFNFFFLESSLFMCLSVMRFFSLQVFPFLITVAGWYSCFDVLNFNHLFNSTSVAIVALANSRWSVFIPINCHKLVVSTSFWSWLLNVSSVLTSLKYPGTLFLGVNALWTCWRFLGVLSFYFAYLCFWNMSFFVFFFDAIFCGTIFFIFEDSVWLVKSSWCVHCCFIRQIY